LRPVVGLEARPERAGGVVESGLHSPDGDGETIGHLGEGQADVVVEHENRPLLDGQPPEGSIELVAVIDRLDLGRLRLETGKEADLR
jgi:hypothetical protein